jgi:hypothetical protein
MRAPESESSHDGRAERAECACDPENPVIELVVTGHGLNME